MARWTAWDLLTEQGKGRFAGEFRCAGRRGRHQIEITARSRRGPAVLANFPVWCAAQPPTTVTWRQRTDDGSFDVAAAERRMVELVNRDRATAGLQALIPDLALAAVARRHSAEMARLGLVAHTLESTGTAADRLRAANIHTAGVAENLARAGDIYIRKASRVDAQAARATISEIVRSKIRVEPDVALEGLAQAQAEGIARGMPSEIATARTVDSLQAQGLPFVRVRALFAAVTTVDAFSAQQAENDLRMTHFGIGIAQGDHPELGKNTIFIVVLLGQRSAHH